MVSVEAQRLTLLHREREVISYPVSTSRNGIGNRQNSFQTPMGWHRVSDWIGEGLPLGAVMKGRVPTGEVLPPDAWVSDAPQDTITTRILWLDGLEEGRNRGGEVDSRERYIYIHGTNHEQLIGRPASGGCVRMRNRDVLDLFNRTKDKTTFVVIV